ncbi:MAG: 50S ribosomal protein L6 [Armatimonadetes bacterium]|nr:50S ribosomal protein L6 [Armatimonadota bacterium]
MSRIGLLPIAKPNNVKVDVGQGNLVTVEGPKGKLSRSLFSQLDIELTEGEVKVSRRSDNPEQRSMHGLTRTLIANMIEGVSKGYEKVLVIGGVGYRAAVEGKNLVLQVGYSHPVVLAPLEGVEFEVGQEPGSREPAITIRGIDKEKVGQQAAKVRAVRPPEPYKGKGIRYRGEQIRRKAGKAAKAGKGG